MGDFIIESYSTEKTMAIAKMFAKYLDKGDVVVLNGDLGAGKTKFVEGFLNEYELQDEISSPTFNIVNEYSNQDIKIYHFDVYRLEDSDEFYEIGGEEYFEQGICLIEWGEIIKDALPKDYIEILISKDENDINKRIFKFKFPDKYKELMVKFMNEAN